MGICLQKYIFLLCITGVVGGVVRGRGGGGRPPREALVRGPRPSPPSGPGSPRCCIGVLGCVEALLKHSECTPHCNTYATTIFS